MNQENTINRNSTTTDVLAKVLAVENLTVIHSAKAYTASFNTETRTLTLPCFVNNIKQETRNMFVGHEVGHALFSPGSSGEKKSLDIIEKAISEIDPDPNNKSIVMGYLNVVEDARIERLFKIRYPGLIPDFKIGYNELLERDFFRIRNIDINSLPLIDRINLQFKCMNAPEISNLEFTSEEKQFLNKIQNSKTWSDVVSVTKEIYEYSAGDRSQIKNENDMQFVDGDDSGEWKEKKEENGSEKGNEKGEKNDSGKGSEESDSNDSKNSKSESKNDNSESSKSNKSSDDSDNDSGDSNSGDDESESRSGENENVSEDEDEYKDSGSKNKQNVIKEDREQGESKSKNMIRPSNSLEAEKNNIPTKKRMCAPKSKTYEAFSENLKYLVDKNAKNNLYLKIPKIELKDFVTNYKVILNEYRYIRDTKPTLFEEVKKHFLDFKKNNTNKINYLFTEFNRKKKAEEQQKDKNAKSGTIDFSKIVHYKYSDDIFKSNTIKYIGKNHSLTAFIDFSGSMVNNILNTVEQALCLALFAKKAGIPFELYTFGHSSFNMKQVQYSENDIMVSKSFLLRQFFSVDMTYAEFHEACENLLAATGVFSGVASYKDFLGTYTPLSDTLITAIVINEKIAKERKTTYNHVLLLTDGVGTNLMSYYSKNQKNVIDSNIYNIIIHDPVTKKDFTYNAKDYGMGDRVFAEILRHRTGCNIVGFFCTGGGKEDTIKRASNFINNKNITLLSAEYDRNNFITCFEKGYTEYYIIPGGSSLGIKNIHTYDLSEYYTHLKKDRILLNRFIHLITEKGKMV
jgi:hypothetical protein